MVRDGSWFLFFFFFPLKTGMVCISIACVKNQVSAQSGVCSLY